MVAGYPTRTIRRNLVEVGATGAMIWCFADYAEELWEIPPCGESRHERHFGLIRPDGTLKPHAEIIKEFADTCPVVKPIPDYARFPGLIGDDFYGEKRYEDIPLLYQEYLNRKESAND